jgi:16S rRNA pseudouridine516 synthase
MQMRLDKLLSAQSEDSRSKVKIYLKQGRITVDGVCEKIGKTKIDTGKNVVELDGKIVNYVKYTYIMLNKPEGVVSATTDYLNDTVIDIMEEKYKYMDLFPVGRLDIDTVGLIILTNDGKFAHNTLSPKRHVTKIYRARVFGEVTKEDVEAFKQGIEINTGYVCKPAILNIVSSGTYSEVTVQIQEGKFHQIKKMFYALKKNVVFLQRVQFCNIKLDESLQEGEARELNSEEMKVIDMYIDKG